MPLSKLERLNKLYENDKLPPKQDQDSPHIADLDLKSSLAGEQKPWKIPESAQYPRRIIQPPLRSGRDIDQMTSSDEDEYVSAFRKAPTSKPSPPSRLVKLMRHNANASGYPEDNESKSTLDAIQYTSDGKPKANGPEAHHHRISLPLGNQDGLRAADDAGNRLSGRFCSLSLVAKFPYKYMVDANDRVSKHFFAQGKFYARSWDIYCIAPPGYLLSKPILLLPFEQVKDLMDDINLAFKSSLHVPTDPFTLSFFEDGTPQPIFLGTSTSREEIANMQDSIPLVDHDHGGSPANASQALDHSFATFRAKMERAVAANKKKAMAVRKKKTEDRFLAVQDWCQQLKRAQRYFGLRPRALPLPEPNPSLLWAQQQDFERKHLKLCGRILDPLDVAFTAPHPFEKEPVFICVDIESYERAHHLITEIGVSTLDTLDLVDVPLGTGGEHWVKHIRSRHFRIRAREHLENKEFCIGNAANFQFGASEFVTEHEAAEAVDQCFEYPFSVQFKHDGKLKQVAGSTGNFGDTVTMTSLANGSDESTLTSKDKNSLQNIGRDITGSSNSDPVAATSAVASAILQSQDHDQKGGQHRNIILVGHDLGSDLAYLRQLGSQIFSPGRNTSPIAAMEVNAHGTSRSETLAAILEALDTGILYRVLVKEQQTRSLARVLGGVGKTGWYLHNGGNDARYTLEALVGIVVAARLEEDERQGQSYKDRDSCNPKRMSGKAEHEAAGEWDKEVERRIKEKSALAEQDVREEAGGWRRAGAVGTCPNSARLGTIRGGDSEDIRTQTNPNREAVDRPADRYNGLQKSLADADGGEAGSLNETLNGNAAKKKERMSLGQKRREWEMNVWNVGLVDGPCEWHVRGKDGCVK